MFDAICDAIHRELHTMEQKYQNGTQLSGQDLEHIDKMAHALKSLATYEAMTGSEEYGDSHMRGRSRTTGRYISRDSGYSNGYNPTESDFRRY